MFETFRRAWRDAVDNFWHELEAGAEGGDARARAVYREIASARNQLARLDADIGDCRLRLHNEREQVDACERRRRLAAGIGDDETARVAADFLARHQERADVLARKLDALHAERDLCRRDLADMERALVQGGLTAPRPELDDLDRHPREFDFQGLERNERERAAAERLEELKRRARE
jgi:phage shock protein A